MSVHYKGRGLTHFIYGFEPGTQINNFRLTLHVTGTRNVDYPVSTMTPTNIDRTSDGSTLTWQLDRSLTDLNIGVLLPDKLNIAKQIAVMARRAPVFYLLFLISVYIILALAKQPIRFLNIAVISVIYFFFYPLFAYLSVYLTPFPAFAVSFGVLGLLLLNYARILYTLRLALVICVAYTFYLGVTSIAALFPTHTGLILVIESVVILAIVIHVLSHYRNIHWFELFGISKEAVSRQSKTPRKPPDKLVTPPPLDMSDFLSDTDESQASSTDTEQSGGEES
jgi:hypothetical protein